MLIAFFDYLNALHNEVGPTRITSKEYYWAVLKCLHDKIQCKSLDLITNKQTIDESFTNLITIEFEKSRQTRLPIIKSHIIYSLRGRRYKLSVAGNNSPPFLLELCIKISRIFWPFSVVPQCFMYRIHFEKSRKKILRNIGRMSLSESSTELFTACIEILLAFCSPLPQIFLFSQKITVLPNCPCIPWDCLFVHLFTRCTHSKRSRDNNKITLAQFMLSFGSVNEINCYFYVPLTYKARRALAAQETITPSRCLIKFQFIFYQSRVQKPIKPSNACSLLFVSIALVHSLRISPCLVTSSTTKRKVLVRVCATANKNCKCS